MTAAPARACCATSSSARAGAPARIQARLVTGPGKIDRDSLTAPPAGLDGLLWTRQDSVGETTQGGETELLAGSERFEEELGGMRFRISAEAFFQTNTEMAERLYELAHRVRPARRLRARLRPVLRDRHDRPADLAAGGRGVGAGAGPGGDRRRDRQRPRQRGRQRPLLRRRRAAGAARAGRDAPAGPTC